MSSYRCWYAVSFCCFENSLFTLETVGFPDCLLFLDSDNMQFVEF